MRVYPSNLGASPFKKKKEKRKIAIECFILIIIQLCYSLKIILELFIIILKIIFSK